MIRVTRPRRHRIYYLLQRRLLIPRRTFVAKDDSSSDTKKMEAIIDRGVRLKKGIAMGGMDSPSNVDHGGKVKTPTAAQAGKRNKSAY